MTDQPPPNEILNVVRQFRSALARKDQQALNRLIDAYGRIYARLQDKITLLMDAIEMDAPTVGQLTRMTRYKALIAQVEDELTGYQAILRDTIDGVSRDAITYASRDTARLLRTMGVQAGFNRLPNDAIQTLLGFLAPDSPLYEHIKGIAPKYVDEIANTIVESVGLGKNPRVIAGLITDDLGKGLTDALRMTRTVQLWSYREASRANYLANSDVVEGWVWSSARDDRTCEACLAMDDGTVHRLDETLDGHYNCRCSPVPVVAGFPPVVTETGEEWFNQQSEAYQREALGPGKYDAWKEGKFEFSQLATKREDAVYGQMTSATPLKDLLEGGGAAPEIAPLPEAPVPTINAETIEQIRGDTPTEYEQQISKQSYETARVYDTNGNVLFTKDGNKSSVSFTDDELASMKGGILTHNHPASSSFSVDDIGIMVQYKLEEIRAVGDLASYSMVNAPNSPWEWVEVRNAIQYTAVEISKRTGESSIPWDTLWSVTADALGFKYRRLK